MPHCETLGEFTPAIFLLAICYRLFKPNAPMLADPDVANIVALQRDFQGRMFLGETYRQDKGIEFNRGHEDWMDDVLAAQIVADRIRYIRKYIPDLLLLTDSDQDGAAT